MTGPLSVVLGGVIFIVLFVALMLLLYFVPIPLWITAKFARVPVSITALIGMRLRKVPPPIIVNSMVMAISGLSVDCNKRKPITWRRERIQVIRACSATRPISADLRKGLRIDLAGRDVLEAVQMSVKPKMIDAPDPRKGSDKVAAIAKDGIQLLAKAKVTVRANLHRIVGGAGEETVIAPVGEGIVTPIGSRRPKAVLRIRSILRTSYERLDAGTAFVILSIDIAEWSGQ
jgi:uncharacterized protein YqfA (UPF0365 family)